MAIEPRGRTDLPPLRAAFQACRTHFVHAALFSGFINILYLAPSVYMLQVYDRAVPTRGVPTLLVLTLIYAVAVATLTGLDWIRSRLLIDASGRLDRLLAPQIIEALLRSSIAAPRAATALRDFDQLRQTVSGQGLLALFDLPWAPIYVLVCFLLHPTLGFMAIGSIAIVGGLSWLNERATRKPLNDANHAASAAYGSLDGTLSAAGVVKALGMRDGFMIRHQQERLQSLALQHEASVRNAGFVSLTKGIRIALQSLALGLGAYLAMEQQISGGAIFAVSLLLSRALSPIELLTGASKSLIQGAASYRTIRTLLADAEAQRDPTALPRPIGHLRVEGLGVGRTERQRPMLEDVSFDVPAGRILGIVGPSGAGKSTLARAIAGAAAATVGTVRLDGASLADWPEDQLGAAIGYVPQESSLFRGSVRDNICRFRQGDKAAVDAEVVRAARACGVHDFILTLPDGYDTQLGWRGSGLSSGQAQRVALARALYGSPAVVILDEPNANLDGDGEAHLSETLRLLKQRGATVVVIAHRTAVLAAVDMLLVLRDGRVQHFGDRDDVLHRLSTQGLPSPQAMAA